VVLAVEQNWRLELLLEQFLPLQNDFVILLGFRRLLYFQDCIFIGDDCGFITSIACRLLLFLFSRLLLRGFVSLTIVLILTLFRVLRLVVLANRNE
jgi:hypothetical protein